MKGVAALVLTLLCIASFVYAQEAAQMTTATAEAAPAEPVTLKGEVIDNMCADANRAGLADFVKTHTKDCATAPACVASGYSIFADGNLIKFDKESSAKVAEFLNKPESKLQVVVVAKKVGDELSLVSIENQQ